MSLFAPRPTVLLEIYFPLGDDPFPPFVMEKVFTALHAPLKGRRIALEIAASHGSARLFIRCDEDLAETVKNRLYAVHPGLRIVPARDYAAEESGQLARLYELALSRSDLFPIGRHGQFRGPEASVEPLADILQTFSSLPDGDEAWAQFVVSPNHNPNWYARALKAAKMITRGLLANHPALRDLFLRGYLAENPLLRLLTRFSLYHVFYRKYLGRKSPFELEVSGNEALHEGHGSETMAAAVNDKIARRTYRVNIRLVSQGGGLDRKLKESLSYFSLYGSNHLNAFRVRAVRRRVESFRQRRLQRAFHLSVEELAGLIRLPGASVHASLEKASPKVPVPPSRLPVLAVGPGEGNPMNGILTHRLGGSITPIGRIEFQGRSQAFGLRREDRFRHVAILGKTGMGKTTLLENMVLADLFCGQGKKGSAPGLCLVDPHGDLAERVVALIPRERTNDVVYFNPADTAFPLSFNPLAFVSPSRRSMAVAGVVDIFHTLYADFWGPRLEDLLRNSLYAILEWREPNLLWLLRMLDASEAEFRRKILSRVSDPEVRHFWKEDFENMTDARKREATAAPLNKLHAFLLNPLLRNILCQPSSRLNPREVLDEGKILVCNLAKGRLGETNARLIGSFLVNRIQLAALSRADIPEEKRRPFFLVVDEFQNVVTSSFVSILSEARKYRLGLTLANQYFDQIPESVRTAVLGNVGTFLCFAAGPGDAALLTRVFPDLRGEDLVNLGRFQIYGRIPSQTAQGRTFLAQTLPPASFRPDPRRYANIVRATREKYARPRADVEHRNAQWRVKALHT